MFFELIQRMRGKKYGFTSPRSRTSFQALPLGLEFLEERILPSVDLNAAIVGLPASDQVNQGTGVTVQADVSGTTGSPHYSWILLKSQTPISSGSGSAFNFTPTTAGSYDVSLSVTDASGTTATADQPLVVATGGLQQGGFETPFVGKGISAYRYDPRGSAWTFVGAAGVAGNKSAITMGDPPAPEGTQVAFLQGTASFSQTATLVAGTYTLNFDAAQRVNNPANFQTIRVQVDGTTVGTVTPTGTSYAPYSTNVFTVTAGPHTITFAGVDTNTAFVDQVQLHTVPGAPLQVSITGTPASGTSNAGTVIALNAQVSGGAAGTDSYSWAATENNQSIASGTTAAFAFTPVNPGTVQVFLTALDSSGAQATSSQLLQIADVTPTTTVSGPPWGVTGQPQSFTASATDSSPAVNAAGYTYAWTFGDGGTASGASASHTYTTPGTYTVTVTSTDVIGTTSSATTSEVIVAPLQATITGAPAANQTGAGTAVTLGSQVSGGAAGSDNYTWTLTTGGQTIASATTASFTFTPANPGAYQVSLGITDAYGETTTTTQALQIADVPPMTTASGPAWGVTGQAQSFTASATDISPAVNAAGYTYAWTFGDGGTATGSTVGHVYTTPGTYTVMVTATDVNGGASSATTSVLVVAPLQANITGAPAANQTGAGTAVTLGSQVSGGAAGTDSYSWSLTASGQTIASATTASFTFTPANPGAYQVSLGITDAYGETTTTTQALQIADVPPTTTASGLAWGVTGQAQSFTASATDISPAVNAAGYTYAWTFGDGGTATGATAGHVYTTPGSYTVTVTATDVNGGASNATTSVLVVAPLQANITGAPASNQSGAGTAITLGSQVSGGDAGTDSYSWSLTASGQTIASGNAASFTFTPANPGTYQAILNVTDSYGETATTTQSLQIADVAPTTTVSGPPSGQTVQTLSFTASATDVSPADNAAGYTFAWNFGDGSTATGVSASHAYATAKTYTITVAAADVNGGASNATMSVLVYAPVQATITGVPASGQSNAGTALTLGSQVTGGAPGADTYSWVATENSQTIASGTTAAFTFTPDVGTAQVSLTVTDSSGSKSTTTRMLQIKDVPPTVTAGGPSAAQTNQSLSFTASATDPSTIDTLAGYTYTWNFGDGGTGTGSSISHVYSTAGTYTVTATATDVNGGASTATTSVIVTASQVSASLLQGGFESPSLGTGAYGDYQYDPTGSAWTFTGQAGVAANGSGFTGFNPNAPQGTQVGFLQILGSFSQTVNLSAGTYSLSFQAAQRGANTGVPNQQSFQVSVDGVSVGTFTPASGSYNGYATVAFSVGAGSHSISFHGLNPVGGDNTALIDQVQLASASLTPLQVSINGLPASGHTSAGTAVPLNAVLLGGAAVIGGASVQHYYSWTVLKNGVNFASGNAATFTFTPNDQSTYQVSVTVTDSLGESATTSAVLNPPLRATITGVPASGQSNAGTAVPLGSQVTGGAVGSDSYSWVATENGQTIASGTTAAFTFTPPNPGVVQVSLTATDSSAATSTSSRSWLIADVAPTTTVNGSSSGQTGQTLSFTASATDVSPADNAAGYTFTWNFGDGGTATGATASHAYTTVGTYTVTVTATDVNGGASGATRSVLVYAPVQATITGVPASGQSNAGTALTLGSQVTGGAPGPDSYSWVATENSQTIASSATAAFTFTPDVGTAQISLTVTDSSGAKSTTTRTLQINDVPPTVTVQDSVGDGPATLHPGQSVSFTASATDPSQIDTLAGFVYAWNFGDGSSGTGSSISHVYSAAGSYTVTVTATDINGGVGSATTSVIVTTVGQVYPTLEQGGFESPSLGTGAYGDYQVDPTGSDWTFSGQAGIAGNGSAYTSFNPNAPEGTQVAFLDMTSTFAQTVNMSAGTYALSFKAAQRASNTYVPNQQSFQVSVDGVSVGTFTPASGSYNSYSTVGFSVSAGPHTILFQGLDPSGGDNAALIDQVQLGSASVTPLQVSISGLPASGHTSAGSALQLNAALLGGAAVIGGAGVQYNYSWTVTKNGANFASGNATTFTFTPDDQANYQISLTVTDSLGETATTSQALVGDDVPPTAAVTGPSYGVEGQALSFTGSATDIVQPDQAAGYSYTWNFGDGSSASGATVSHTYAATGTYQVTVTATDKNGSKDSASMVTYVTATALTVAEQLNKPVLNQSDFSYLGSFTLPISADGTSTAFSTGGLSYRYVNGNIQFFTTTTTLSGGLVYTFNDPGLGTSTNPNSLPQAQVVNNWGDVYTGQKWVGNDGGSSGLSNATDTYGLYYDQTTNRLYWNYGFWYNASNPNNPSLGYSVLNNSSGTATGIGAYSLTNRPEKFDRGGVTAIPQWFANSYTGGDNLGVGFGGYFSIISTGSMGPALAAVAAPNSAVNADDSSLPNVPLIGYPNGDGGANTDPNYSSTVSPNPTGTTGSWNWSDIIYGAGTWIDTPNGGGVLFIAKVGQGDAYYQTSDRHTQGAAYEWMVYNPNDLAAVASGAKQQWQIQPEYEWTSPTLPVGLDQGGYSGDGQNQIGGITFDPTTNRLYVLSNGVWKNGVEYYPEMYVYQVGAAPAPQAEFSAMGPVVAGNTGTVFFKNPVGGSGNYTYSYDFNNTGVFEVLNSTSLTATVPVFYLDNGPGNYVIHGRITDSSSGLFTDFYTTITVNAPPTASISALSSGSVGSPVTFSGSATGTSPLDNVTSNFAYSWTFGDGLTATGMTVNHSYLSAGSYLVTLTATDPFGTRAVSTWQIAII